MRTIEHWIGGTTTSGTSTRTAPVWNPATGEQQAQVVLASAQDVDDAVAAALAAFEDWSQASLSQRTKVLFAFRELVNAHVDELAALITDEHGKVALRRARRGAARPRGRRVRLRHPAPAQGRLLRPGLHRTSTRYSFREPLGVVAGITPFNFPVMVPMWMHPVAIACGNTFVLKPSERDPRRRCCVAELWQQAGLPDGVFNVVHGDKEAVDALLDHPDVAAVSFVGSTPIAQYIHRAGHRDRQARPGPGRRQEPRDRPARRRRRLRRRPPRRRRVRLGRRALHGRSPPPSPSARRATRSSRP